MGIKTTGRASLRTLRGLVCPRCHRHVEESAQAVAGSVLRCPGDGAVLVTTDALAAADGDPFLGALIAGRYAVLSRLGAGSMGTVYRARVESQGRDVAVKIVRTDRLGGSDAKARFMREVRAMSMLQSPHTVTVYDFGEVPRADLPGGEDEPFADGAPVFYLAMELLLGEPLGERLARCFRLSVQESLGIAQHALLSLAEAHDKGVIHRDLKPDNLFLTEPEGPGQEEICKLLDFGIAKIADDKNGAKHGVVGAADTQEGVVFGTPRYMSPEQAQGKSVDARSDLYTLGVLLYQMLVGEPPFVDDEAVVVMAHHIKTQPIPPDAAAPDAGIPAEVSDLVMRALAKDPALRPQSAREFFREIEKVMRPGVEEPETLGAGLLEVPVNAPAESSESGRAFAEPQKRGGDSRASGFHWGRALVAVLAVACGVTVGIWMFEFSRSRLALVAAPVESAMVSAELSASAPALSASASASAVPVELGDIDADDAGAAVDAGALSDDAGLADSGTDTALESAPPGYSSASPMASGSAKWPAVSTSVRPPPFRIHRRFNSER